MVMSALTVRANMKMVFDNPAADKAQASYMRRIALMESAATQHTGKMNRKLIRDHKQLVMEMEKSDTMSKERLAQSADEIAKRVRKSSKAAMDSIEAPKDPGLDSKHRAKYLKDVAEYEAASKKIVQIQKRTASEAKKLGMTGQKGATGARITEKQFLNQEVSIRKQIIALAEMEVQKTRAGSFERRMAQVELNRYLSLQKMIGAEEFRHTQQLRENAARVRASQIALSKGLAANNAMLKERMALLQRINMAISTAAGQLLGTFQNALMFSGIALMSFGFKLQGLISDFIAFEKELMNAQSIYQQSFETLFQLSDAIVLFSTKFGVTLQDASEGLYTLASAGLEAEDSMAVLTETLKLAMAVQGDHDTVAKLTTQVIFGFKKEVEDSAEIVDMFAHSINKSLIEYQDLASSVKFAMPFFVATNQELEQLLGALQILSNRALEAGIAGRGLRQTLAEFAQHAEDNTAAFAKLGIQLLDSEGMFKDLTVIAKEFHDAFPDINDNVDMMTTLLEDLNVRGATAFVHLVREADDFQEAVDDLQNSTGAATEMAEIQQKSLANQIQVVKNALMAPFLLSTKVEGSNEVINTFGKSLHDMTADFERMFLEVTPEGGRRLTEFGKSLRESVLVLLEDLIDIVKQVLHVFVEMNGETNGLSQIMHGLLIPLKLLLSAFDLLGEGGIQTLIMFKIMTGILPIAQAQIVALTHHTIELTMRQKAYEAAIVSGTAATEKETIAQAKKYHMGRVAILQQREIVFMQLGANAAMFAGLMLINKTNEAYQKLGYVLLGLAGAFTAAAIARSLYSGAAFGSPGMIAAMASGAIIFAGMGKLMKDAMKPPKMDVPEFNEPVADLGMRMYDMGGKTKLSSLGGRHFPVLVEPGETIIPKTQNMLGGSGITLNIQGDIVTNDAEDFAERIVEVLPEALRRQNDMGGI